MRTILILTANPQGNSRRLDQEVRDIEEGLRRAKKRNEFFLESRFAVRPRDIRRAMLDINPSIVHFSGHGTGDEGLVFEDETGSAKLIDGEALAGLFQLFSDKVECVVLNGCYSEVQAEAIVQHINYVIGMKEAIGDKAAIEFAVGFYDALGAGESIERAHKFGCTAIQLAGIPEQFTPVLKKKLNIDPEPSKNEHPQDNQIYTIVTAGELDSDWRLSMEENSAALGTRAITKWTQRVDINSKFKLIYRATNDAYEIRPRVEINGDACLTTYPDGVLKLDKCNDTLYQQFAIACKKKDTAGNLSGCYIVNKQTNMPIGTLWDNPDKSKNPPNKELESFTSNNARWWVFVVQNNC